MYLIHWNVHFGLQADLRGCKVRSKQDPELQAPAFYKVLYSSETNMIDLMSEVYCSS
jgi:hypothetical protein